MNEQSLQARIAELTQQRHIAVANLHQLDGAIADCNYWLTQIRSDTVKIDENEGND